MSGSTANGIVEQLTCDSTMEDSRIPHSMQKSRSDNHWRALRGELYYAFTPEMVRLRKRCSEACRRYNSATDALTRRQMDPRPLPAEWALQDMDDVQFEDDPWVEAPIHIDYGTNLELGAGVFINFNCTVIDTCHVSIGARTLVGPNVSLYSGTHPIDPRLRNGTKGPELGREIHIGEDCWIGGNVVILPGVTIGDGSTVGAGSVVTKDVPPLVVTAGNPARILRRINRLSESPEIVFVDGELEQDREPIPRASLEDKIPLT
ncbi:hypothetical protein B0A49_02418 [Cryomyces minteri]|uniref:Maltose/galactoside acetyltransferase domain-containing protein n=1 Tax=Cryomyces minteri TaxID=331657 RepID=A0A4V5NHX0_9PEZI|nr:hypothetical protein B0A49_08395 [Cryomyces minteri]TKA74719.1 hypothetical protein B0A49_02418 [Cryomyces minteri]